MLYALFVAPGAGSRAFEPAFSQMIDSLRIDDARGAPLAVSTTAALRPAPQAPRRESAAAVSPSSRLRLRRAASSTASMSVVRRPPGLERVQARDRRAAGRGDHVLELPGVLLVSISSFAEPSTVCAASACAL